MDQCQCPQIPFERVVRMCLYTCECVCVCVCMSMRVLGVVRMCLYTCECVCVCVYVCVCRNVVVCVYPVMLKSSPRHCASVYILEMIKYTLIHTRFLKPVASNCRYERFDSLETPQIFRDSDNEGCRHVNTYVYCLWLRVASNSRYKRFDSKPRGFLLLVKNNENILHNL